ncbi:MAG TPA: hypothetical protein VKT52_01480, partial [Ktedonobacterales bacterium]|nr:hypothetical protein [Ktedonobacterales bacterium]
QLNEAYRVLGDPDRRRAYDAERGLSVAAAPSPAHSTAPAPSSPPQEPPTTRRGPRVGSVRANSGSLRRIAMLETRDDTPVAALALARGGALAGVGLLDGRVQLWDAPSAHLTQTLRFAAQSSAGVLQELRLSPGGALAIAWGFQLGTRVWSVEDGRTLWNTAINAPTGAMDAMLYDTPALVRLALPDAPLALADDDPFRWAHQGRGGSAVLARPLAGPIDPAWALPLRCEEASGGGLFGDPPDPSWRVHLRALSLDGRYLFTFSSGRTSRLPAARVLRLWELDRHNRHGATQPRRVAQTAVPVDDLQFPVAVAPDLSWAAARALGREMRLFPLSGGERRTLPTGAVSDEARMMLSPGGGYLALARDTQLDLWHIPTARQVAGWVFSTEVTAVAFAPAGAQLLLAAGLRNGLVELWA